MWVRSPSSTTTSSPVLKASGGQVIGSNDLWIAAQAIRNDLVLVTANEREFARVPNLKLENWR